MKELNYLNEAKKNREGIVKDICDFIRIPSVLEENLANKEAPFGKGVRESLDYILNLAKSFGFKTRNIENVCGEVEYGSGDKILGVLCHIDVVPAEGKWTYPPFSGEVVGDTIYGRGTVDDKGPAIASLYALKILKDNNIMPKWRIRLIYGCDEETAMRGVARYLQLEDMPTFGISPDADFPIIYGEKGIASIDIIGKNNDPKLTKMKGGKRYNIVCDKVDVEFGDKEYKFEGVPAHAMEPNNGVNAILKACKELENQSNNNLIKFVNLYLGDSRLKDMGLDVYDKEMKDLTCNVAIVDIDKDHSRLGLNFRYPLLSEMPNLYKVFKEKAKELDLEVKILSDTPPHYINPEEEEIKTLHKAYIKYTNDDKTPLLTIGGGTYARVLKKGVAFGMMFPGDPDLCHQADERISIEKTLLGCAILAEAMEKLTEK